jgi:Tol biopolymer transport system component
VSVAAAALLLAISILVGCARASADRTRATTARAIPPAKRATFRGLIAYTAKGGSLWLMNGDGTHRRRLTRAGSGGVDFDPSFAPNGRRIVFRTSRGSYIRDPNGTGVEGIFVIDIATRRERQIQPRTGGMFPDWSPRGSEIVFSGLRRGQSYATLFLVSPAGGKPRDLGLQMGAECGTFSPDGEWIAFCSHGPDGTDEWSVWVVRRDGSDLRRLTHGQAGNGPFGSGGDHPSVWSRDGKRILYSGQVDGEREMFSIKLDGGDAQQLTHWPAGGDDPEAVLPDGRIVFAHFFGDAPLPRFYVVNPDGSKIEALPWLHDAGAGDPTAWWWR